MLLPHVYKTVGFIVAAIGGATLIVFPYFHLDKIFQSCCMAFIVIGLYVAAISRDRQEDEMLRSIRFAALFAAFGYGVLVVAIDPFADLIFSIQRKDSNFATVLRSLFFYHFMFYIMKRSTCKDSGMEDTQ